MDVHLLAAARLAGVALWTVDRRLDAVAGRLGMSASSQWTATARSSRHAQP